MTNWPAIRDAYGPAERVPTLIEALPDHDAFEELWSRLCHQGTVYPASFAALPLLTRMTYRLADAERTELLALIALIVSSNDLCDVPTRPEAEINALLPELQAIAERALHTHQNDQTLLPYALLAYCAFHGAETWARNIELVMGAEPLIECSYCAKELVVVAGLEPFVAALGWQEKPQGERPAVRVASRGELGPETQWLMETLEGQGRGDLAARLPALVGKSSCPYCTADLNLAELTLV